MEMNYSWLQEEPIQSICQRIRLSLSHATRVRTEDGEESESKKTTVRPKFRLECGYAKYSGKKRAWNLRHRANTVAGILESTSRKESFDSLTISKGSSPSTTPLRLLHAKFVAKIREKASISSAASNRDASENDKGPFSGSSPPPLELFQCILRSAEFSSMLKHARFQISTTPSRPPKCPSRFDKQAIDLGPILDFIQENYLPAQKCNLTSDGILDRAIQYSLFLSGDSAANWAEVWDVRLADDSYDPAAEKDLEPAFLAIQAFARSCLEQRADQDEARLNDNSILGKRKRNRQRSNASLAEHKTYALDTDRSKDGDQLKSAFSPDEDNQGIKELYSRTKRARTENTRKHIERRADWAGTDHNKPNGSKGPIQMVREDSAPLITEAAHAAQLKLQKITRRQHLGQALSPIRVKASRKDDKDTLLRRNGSALSACVVRSSVEAKKNQKESLQISDSLSAVVPNPVADDQQFMSRTMLVEKTNGEKIADAKDILRQHNSAALDPSDMEGGEGDKISSLFGMFAADDGVPREISPLGSQETPLRTEFSLVPGRNHRNFTSIDDAASIHTREERQIPQQQSLISPRDETLPATLYQNEQVSRKERKDLFDQDTRRFDSSCKPLPIGVFTKSESRAKDESASLPTNFLDGSPGQKFAPSYNQNVLNLRCAEPFGIVDSADAERDSTSKDDIAPAAVRTHERQITDKFAIKQDSTEVNVPMKKSDRTEKELHLESQENNRSVLKVGDATLSNTATTKGLRRSPRKRLRWNEEEQLEEEQLRAPQRFSPGSYKASTKPESMPACSNLDLGYRKIMPIENGFESMDANSEDRRPKVEKIVEREVHEIQRKDSVVLEVSVPMRSVIVGTDGPTLNKSGDANSERLPAAARVTFERKPHDKNQHFKKGRTTHKLPPVTKVACNSANKFAGRVPRRSKKKAPVEQGKTLHTVGTGEAVNDSSKEEAKTKVTDESDDAVQNDKAPMGHTSQAARGLGWVTLSHVGLISDYHGIQRMHDAFLPLKFSKSVTATRDGIDDTLKSIKFGKGEDNDEEIRAETKEYLRLIREYKQKSEKDISRRKIRAEELGLSKLENTKKHNATAVSGDPQHSNFASRPLLFSVDSEEKLEECKVSEKCLVCGKLEDLTRVDSVIPSPTFKAIESDTLDFWQEEGGSNKQRRSRTSELIAQKNISAMMLSEMSHTLRFIEEYNKWVSKRISKDVDAAGLEEKLQNEEAEAIEPSLDPVADEECTSKKINGEVNRKARSKEVSSTSSYGDMNNLHGEAVYRSICAKPIWVKLSHAGLLSDYQGLQRKYQSFYTIPTQGTIESLKESIKSLLDGNDRGCSGDEEALLEQKAHTRIVRGYQGKSDQERIEKKEHEEERMLKLREYEYINRKRKGKRKASPEELEYDRLEARPVHFTTTGAEPSATRRPALCKFGENCSLCAPIGENGCSEAIKQEQQAIFHPRYRRVNVDDIDEADSQNEGRRSRTAELKSQRNTSLKNLEEMYHTLEFIEKYNKGRISTAGKKKRQTRPSTL
jgi:hypothetical protein